MNEYQITKLADSYSDSAVGINESGIAVGTLQPFGVVPRAVRWSPNEEILPTSLSYSSTAESINDDGAVVGWGYAYNPPEPTGPASRAFYFANGVMHDMWQIFGWVTSRALDINKSGLIAQWVRGPGPSRAFVYNSKTGAAPVDLGVLPGHEISYATAVNNDNQVLGVSFKPAPTPNQESDVHAFLYDGELIDLGTLPGYGGSANDINDSGQIVGKRLFGAAKAGTAFLYDTAASNPTFVDLGLLDDPAMERSEALAINSNGDIVGFSSGLFVEGADHAFVRLAGGPHAGQMRNLNSLIPSNSGWLLNKAYDINDSGQIVGEGTYGGATHAYLLTPVSIFANLSHWYATIDPLALLLPGPVYGRLTKSPPVPPEGPFDSLNAIRELLRMMRPTDKKSALARLHRVRNQVNDLEEMLKQT